MGTTAIPAWEAQGFAAMPEWFVATGNEVVLRAFSADAATNLASADTFVSTSPSAAYDRETLVRRKAHGSSRREGNCYFVPAFGQLRGPIRNGFINVQDWTGAYLDRHLNAFIWGNDYRSIATFLLAAGTQYQIGPIGQGVRRVEQWVQGQPIVEQNWSAPGAQVSTEFRQVTIDNGGLRPVLLGQSNILGLPALSSTRH